jgi:cytochrome P450
MLDSGLLETRVITQFDFSDTRLYTEDRWRVPFAELRKTHPLSFLPDSPFGAYWSALSHDLVQQVEAKPDVFSSADEYGGITIEDMTEGNSFPNFIAMDGEKHAAQRKVVQQAFNPSEMARRESEIRVRTKALFDALPIGEEFDWVETVAMELTIGMLSILFDFPWEDRYNLRRWSDLASAVAPDKDEEYRAHFFTEMHEMLATFDQLFAKKLAQPPSDDLLSRMIHSEAMGQMPDLERLANIALLIVAGNDTTRNSMSAFVHACHLFPQQLEKLRADRSLIPNAANEIIRWQSPVTHMRRTAKVDTELAGQVIKKGEKIVLWYISANYDETVFAEPENFDVTRGNARRQLGFGYGVHRCVGARLAELQLGILIDEILDRNMDIAVSGKPEWLASPFLHGYTNLPVKLAARQ